MNPVPTALRIVHVNTEPTWRGGESQVFNLMRGLLARGHQVEAVTLPESALLARCREASIPATPIAMRGDLDVAAALRLARHLRRVRPDVVNAQTARAHTLGLLAVHLGAPGRLVVTRRLDFPIRRDPANLWKYRSRRVARYIAVAGIIRDILVGAGVRADRVSVVNSSIDLGTFVKSDQQRAEARAELGIPPGARVLGNVAALAWHKGQTDLLSAMPRVAASFPGAWCVIVGAGDEREPLEKQAAALGGGVRILLTGMRRDVPRLLNAFDVFCMPSHYEGFCNSVLEALATGLPVVATRAGGLPEIVEDGTTGLLVPPRDPEALAAGIVRVLSDAELAHRLSEAGERAAQARFGVDLMVDKTTALYQDAVR
jgi:glycosyltransferase involved in cell wall biosynthesis